jgi:hypothetical protein
MADDKSQTAPQDTARINIHEHYEVQYWTKALGVTRAELEALVKKHGVSADKVREALGRAHA